MKRSPLRRKKPLRPTGPIKRSARPPKTWRRAEDDKVTPAEAQHVLQRDGGCMAVKLDPKVAVPVYGPCRGAYGPEPINSTDLRLMTLQHLWRSQADNTKGKRAPSNRAHLITICAGHHLGGWATSHRGLELQRAHLIKLYPGHRCDQPEPKGA